MIIEFVVDGEVVILSAANNMHEAGIEIRRHKENALKGKDVEVFIDGELHDCGIPIDVRLIAKNSKIGHIEAKCFKGNDFINC